MSARSFVVMGAGKLGQRVARAIQPRLFCDNDQSRWGTSIEGIRIESPAEAVRSFPDATFVVAIWHPSRTEGIQDHIAQLRTLGARQVVSFTSLLPEFGKSVLPHFFWERPDYYAEHSDDIARAHALMDERGREEFDRQMRLRKGDHSGQIIDPGVQYFPDDLFRLSDHEVFVDCGAYDGDTIESFRRATHDRFERIVAFEPDPVNCTSLRAATNGDRRIEVLPYATGARRETLRFSMAGTGSRVSDDGTCEIEAITLDEALKGIAPTYIKFDIEGSEPDALEGGRRTITKHRPKLAVCLYHAPDHLWSLPLLMHELLPNSHMSLRTYTADGFECVCYCLPD